MKRRRFSLTQRASVHERCGGRCQACGTTKGPFEFDHEVALCIGGRDELAALVLICKPCHKFKSAGDVRRWAKCRRLAGETCTGPKRKIASRGFRKDLTKHFDGSVSERRA